jgi:hypothetical protein
VNLLVTVPAGVTVVSQAGIPLAHHHQLEKSTLWNKQAVILRISAMQLKEDA